MDDRRQLVEHLYSREGAAEEPREYRDPATGATVRMTPSQWALAEYDRRHAAEVESTDARSRATSARQGSAPRRADERHPVGHQGVRHHGIRHFGPHDHDGVREDRGVREEDIAGFDDDDRNDDEGGGGGDEPPRRSPQDAPTSPWRRATPALIACGAFVFGVLVAVGISTAVGRGTGTPAAAPTAAGSATVVPYPDDFHPLPGPAIEEYFRNAPRVDDLPAAVTDGFVPTSFHEIAGTVQMQESASIYAAKRLDGQYCLVAVAGGKRVVETCATEVGIADHGLTLTKDAVRDVDGRPLAVTVTWHSDGTISWEAMPSAG